MTPIEKYFNAEKAESLLFVLVGLVAIACAIYFLLQLKQPFYNGMAYPLVVVAILQLTVGISIYVRSPKDILRVNEIVRIEKPKIKAEEIPRMEVVMKNFVLYRWVEIALLLVGLVLFFALSKQSLWQGVGLGLAIQAGFTLFLDYFAESRGKVYLTFLQSL